MNDYIHEINFYANQNLNWETRRKILFKIFDQPKNIVFLRNVLCLTKPKGGQNKYSKEFEHPK